VSVLKHISREKRLTWTKKIGWRLKLQHSRTLSICVCLLHYSEESKMRQRSFRFIKFSFSWDNAWFHTSVVVVMHVSVRYQNYLAGGRFLTILKQSQKHWKIDMMLWGLLKEVNKLSWWEILKVLPRIPEQWWEMNPKMTLKWKTLHMRSSQVSL